MTGPVHVVVPGMIDDPSRPSGGNVYDRRLCDALGASGWTSFWRITFPVILPAIIAGGLLAFTLSVDEFIIAFFTAGAGRSSITLPMQIYSMIRFGITPEINALATLVMGVSATALLISQWLNREQFS